MLWATTCLLLSIPFRPNYTAMLTKIKRLCIEKIRENATLDVNARAYLLSTSTASVGQLSMLSENMSTDQNPWFLVIRVLFIFLPPRRREARAFMSKAEREAPHGDVVCVFSARFGEIMLSRMVVVVVMWIPVNLMVCWWQYGMVEVRRREDPISALFLKGHTHRAHSP